MAGLYSEPNLLRMVVDRFKGVDLSVPEDQMKPYRAAWSENMIPGAVGEVMKRPGVKYKETIKCLATPDATEEGDLSSERIVEMIGGQGMVTEIIKNYQFSGRYTLYVNLNDKLCPLAVTTERPLVVSCGKKNLVFLVANKEEAIVTNRISGFINHRSMTGNWTYSKFKAALVVLDDGKVSAYLETGDKIFLNSAGKYEFKRIPYDDEYLSVPTIIKGADPAGGGSPFQQINILSPWATESFCCTKTGNNTFYLQSIVENVGATTSRLSTEGDLEAIFKVEVLCAIDKNDDGAGHTQTITRWVERPWKCNGKDQDGYRTGANRLFLFPGGNGETDYTDDDGESYKVKIGTGDKYLWTDSGGNGEEGNYIGATPIEGEDNVRITHWRADFAEGFRKLCTAACATVFGVGGYKDRLFLGGCQNNADGYPDRIYYSELEDPFYIGDLNYLKLDDGRKVMALDGTADTLAALTDNGVYLISATAQNNAAETGYVSDALFTVAGHVRAPAPLNYGDTEVLGGEIVYLSKEGVIAIAYKEHFDERFAESRSAMINAQMLKDGPQQLISIGRFLMIRCKNGIWWLLDENQPNSEGNKPYSSHQYEGFRLSGMDAHFAWSDGKKLVISHGSQICTWESDATDHYYDDYTGKETDRTAINAYWETPWIYGNVFYKKKIFRRLGLLLEIADCNSAVKVEGKKNEKDWETLWDYDGTLCTFDYGNIDYRLFTYFGVKGCPDIQRKIRVKKALRVKFRFSNDFINQTLILRQFGLEYEQEE